MSAVPEQFPTCHVPVMVREVLRALELRPGLTVVDGTLGGGGHASRILPQLGPTGRLLGLDRDPEAIARTSQRLSGPNVELIPASYVELPVLLQERGLATVDRILVDLGLSSDQLADPARGFSFSSTGSLDLRFDCTQGMPASQYLQSVREDELVRILSESGEESAARRIAAAIVKRRTQGIIATAADLAQVVTEVLGAPGPRDKHPATRVFQALRIAVNSELEHVQRALNIAFPQCLAPGGILAVISFHSLEDRLAKDAFRDNSRWENLTPKPIVPTPAEERVNPRCRSAKLRVARWRGTDTGTPAVGTPPGS